MEKKIDFLNSIVSLLPEHFDNEVRKFIACQFALESDFGQSSLARCNHNFCGMKVPSLRLTLCSNASSKDYYSFAVYSGITYCVHDYLIWLVYNKFNRIEYNSVDAFARHLKYSNYCPDDDYVEKIWSIYYQYCSPKCKS